METKPGVRAQTLDRALDVLDVLADGQARSSQDLASATGLHRSIVYRILRTLEDRELVRRTAEGRYTMGLGLLVLSRSVLGETQAQLHDVLGELANSLPATAFFAVPRGGQVVTLVTVEPDRDRIGVAAYRPWTRSPMDRGACGLAISAARPPRPEERPEVGWARQTGYVRTVGELHAGLTEIAAPVWLAEGTIGCVAVVFVGGDLGEDKAAEAVRHTAARLSHTPRRDLRSKRRDLRSGR
ncbi:IclR family transcriptional regulator [Amycolatopsis alkalitolerans]|uniref:Helix-turn-helix domain-containing protein n=1 Tax=Amycolatopsis alkalitolerans TaxID=2547244 RepID=A0A5C4LWG4_9PSEU|nr:helix-turn-helix domain-containing protein [Amycolatopsis alkalitolerans]TNC22706.1 helix-turn-helix domain-containing protein [Amycolatopsis alkalitolerans]